MSMVPTMQLRFEKRMVPAPEPGGRIGGGSVLTPRYVLQQMFWDKNQKQVWIDVPTVEEPTK